MLEVEEEAGQRLRVLDLRKQARQLRNRHADVLELLVGDRCGVTPLEAFGEEELHPLSAEARCREEAAHLAPGAPGEAGLLGELPLRALERSLAGLQPTCGKLEELGADGLAQLPDEGDMALLVDRDHRDRVR